MTTSLRRSTPSGADPEAQPPRMGDGGAPNPPSQAVNRRPVAPNGTPEALRSVAAARITAAMRSGAGPDAVLAEVASAANAALGTHAALILAPCGTTGVLEVAASTLALPAEAQLAICAAAETSPTVLSALRSRQTYTANSPTLTTSPLGAHLAATAGAHGLVAVPLIRSGIFLGVLLGISRHPLHPQHAEVVGAGEALAGDLADALSALRGDVEAEGQRRVQSALHQISAAMVSGHSVDAVLQQIAESSLVALCADRVTVWRYHPSEGAFVLGAEAGLRGNEEGPRVLRAEGSGALETLLERQPKVFRNASDASLPIGETGLRFRQFGFDTIAVWPVQRGDEPLAVLCGCYKAQFQLSESDLALGEILANHAAASLHAAEMHEQTAQRAAELRALTDMGRMVAQGRDVATLNELAEAARQALGSETFALWLTDAASEGLRLAASVAQGSETAPLDVADVVHPAVHSPQARAAREQRLVTVVLGSGDGSASLKLVAAAPIMHNGVTLGAVSAEYAAAPADPDGMERALGSVASHFCYALLGMRLQSQVVSHEREVTALRAISAAAVSSKGSSEILEAVRVAVLEAVQAAYGHLWVYDATTDGLLRVGGDASQEADDAPTWRPVDASPPGRALRTGAITVANAGTPGVPPHIARRFASGQVQSVLLVPIGGPTEPLGVLTLGFSHLVALGDPEARVAAALASHAAVALARANALEDHRVTEERLRMVSTTSSELAYGLLVGEEGVQGIEWASQVLPDICGYDREGLAAAGGWPALVHPEDRPRFSEGVARLAAGHLHVSDYRIITRSGEIRHIRDRARPIWSEELQRTVRVFGAARDVTDEVRTQQALEALERFAPATLDALSAQIAILDAEGAVLAVNRAWRSASRGTGRPAGLTPTVNLGANYLSLCDAYRGALAPAATRLSNGIRTVMSGVLSTFRFEYSVPGDGDRWLVATVTQLAPEERSVVVAHEDITDRKRAEEALLRQARFDALTGLPNRTTLLERLEVNLAEAPAHGAKPSLLIMDLDRFKEVNDCFGHETGDVLLRLVADRLTNALQEQYLVARLGGDEFAVLVPGDQASATPEVVADTVVMALRPPFLVDGLVFDIQGSVGVANYPEHGLDVQTLLRRADVAMYVAKHSGTGRAVYTPEQDRNQPRRLSLLAELRRAIDNDELRVVYHPQVELRTGEVEWVEALVRWVHPTLGPLPPDEFVPIAEQSGLIYQLTRWILRRSLRQAASWHRQGVNVGVAVNMSARDLHLPSLPDFVASSLTRYRVPASRLKIEITESSLIDEPEQVLRGVSQLRARGVKVVLDDFGMGYASLTHLKRLPVDELKIDKSFVRDLRVSDLDAAIVRMTIELGHQMGASVVAEGVEDAETHRLLIELGCDAAQGFYLAEPAPPDRFRDWMLQRRTQPLKSDG